MFLKKFDVLALCAKDKLALDFIGSGFSAKNVISRGTHSVRRDRKAQPENDSGIIDPNLSMWRSINAEHKEVEQVPTDQTENIMNYYKDRWIQEHKERKDVETISGTEVSREESSAEKKSLYSQLARKTNTNAHNTMMGGPMGNLGPMGLMGNGTGAAIQADDPSMIQYDPFKLQKTPPHGPLQDVENKERFHNSHIRQNEAAPGFWSSQRSPYNSAAPATGLADQRHQAKPHDPSGPYRPSFSMAEMVGSKSDPSVRSDKLESSPGPDNKQSNRYVSHGTAKVETKDESNSSFSFKPAAPPVPDFKST